MSNDVRRTLGNSKMVSPISTPPNSVYDVDAVIVGAGFAGMYMLYRLRNQGLTVQILEAGDGCRGHLVLESISWSPLRYGKHVLFVSIFE